MLNIFENNVYLKCFSVRREVPFWKLFSNNLLDRLSFLEYNDKFFFSFLPRFYMLQSHL